MKNLYSKLLILSLTLFIFTSCDKVENPYPEGANLDIDTTLFPGNFTQDYVYPTFTPNSAVSQRVFLEDYTGHQCGNCPDANTEAKSIEDAHPGEVYTISIHAGQGGVSSFQHHNEPGDPDYPKYSRDFTNEHGLAYSVEIPGFPANPVGLINRSLNTSGSTNWLYHNTWDSKVTEILASNDVMADIQVENNYYSSTRGLFVHCFIDAKQEMTGNYSVIVMLVEKEIIDWQKNYNLANQDVEDYHHHNVHLDNINSTWGENIISGSASSGDTFELIYSYEVSPEYEEDDLIIYALIKNDDTNEIIQVAKSEVIP